MAGHTDTLKVYKSGGVNNEYLITLLVNPKDTNLNRGGVVNKDTAKYRCRKAFVEEIKHKDTGELVALVGSNHNSKFIYTVGSYVEEPNYNSNINKVCTSGIHFFLTEETALLFNYIPEEYKYGKKVYKSWYDDGRLREECEYKNGEREGHYTFWYCNGQLWEECEYKNGKREGPYKEWHYNGQLNKECEYKKGAPEGPYKSWHDNGQLREECEYKNGTLEGLYELWHDNGQLWVECEYKNGKQEGPYKEWFKNGQLFYEGVYKNGVREERLKEYIYNFSRPYPIPVVNYGGYNYNMGYSYNMRYRPYVVPMRSIFYY